jgi:threonyl-tRNA synthetase
MYATPSRFADFGVLHRNELSGSLGGLTRVRRFVQDDAHVFCRKDQIQAEVLAALQFMKFVYDVFGMTYKLELSTRPLKALGEVSVWNEAEAALAAAMNEFAGEGNWKENPGDGAFYGPKIDIKVWRSLALRAFLSELPDSDWGYSCACESPTCECTLAPSPPPPRLSR